MKFLDLQSALFAECKIVDLPRNSICIVSEVFKISIDIADIHVRIIQAIGYWFLCVIIKLDIIIGKTDLAQYCRPSFLTLWFCYKGVQLLYCFYGRFFYGLRFCECE